MIRLMCDNHKLAYLDDDTDILYLENDVPEWLVPRDLFIGERTSVTFEDLQEWIKDRVFPRDRCGCEDLLRELGLDFYDEWQIAKRTRASLMTDFYWLSFDDSDYYEKFSARGRAKIKPIDWR